jgi:hypothetical protein
MDNEKITSNIKKFKTLFTLNKFEILTLVYLL